MRESRPLKQSLPHFQLVQTVRTHGSGPCDRGSNPRLEATDNLGRRTAPLVIFAPRTGHRSAARRRLEPEMPNEQSEEPSQEPIQNPGAEPPAEGGTDWKAMARKWERLAKSNSEKATAYDELQEQSKSELQRAREKAKGAEDELAELKAKAELAETRARVAKESGVPAELIFGADEGEM